jgi:hypothetical protein
MRLDTEMASQLRTIRKLASIRLNSQTPCPPRGAVPVNRVKVSGNFSFQRFQIAFGHGCDHFTYVNLEAGRRGFLSQLDLRVSVQVGMYPGSQVGVLQSGSNS